MTLRRRIALALSCVLLLAVVLIWHASVLIETASRQRVFTDVAKVNPQRVGLVLGCSPTLRSGAPNPFFVNRLEAAARLWHAHKVDSLLLSGDNHTKSYDEPTCMKAALLRLGVPDKALLLDYAGFSTFDSIVRAKKVFGADEICVISQADHAQRAIYIADSCGLRAIGFAAPDVGGRYGIRTQLREALARVRTVFDVGLFHRRPHFLGPKITIPPRPR